MSQRRGHDATWTTVAGFVVGGGVLAALQILQQVVGVWDAREVVIVLISVAVALAAAAATKWRARTQRGKRLAQELRAWPLPGIDEAEPELLGVFPERRGGRASDVYVERDQDAEIEQAIAESPLVLIYGPPRSGKTCTARHATQKALDDAPVIVPSGPEALDALLDPDLRLDAGESGIVLWLDGLERFADALDARMLEALLGIADRVTIVATIRTEEWDALLEASGQAGEAAKAIASRARAFEVPDDPGIGRERSATGKEGDPPAPPSAPDDSELRGEESAWQDKWLVTPAAACAATLAALGLVILTGGFEKQPPPSVSEQVGAIKQAATRGDSDTAADDRHTVFDPVVDLHGDDEQSHVFVFEDHGDQDIFFSDLFDGDPDGPDSDELVVYDLQDGLLEERFSFQPDGSGAKAARFLITEIGGRTSVGDIDRDGADEFVGGYALPGEASEAMVPFALDWDNAQGRYRMVSLLPEPPPVSERTKVPELSAQRAAYTRPITFRDSESGVALRGYRVQAFYVETEPALRLITGHLVEPRNDRHDGVLQLQAYQFRTGAPRLNPCEISEREILATVPSGGTRSAALERTWEEESRGRNCVSSS